MFAILELTERKEYIVFGKFIRILFFISLIILLPVWLIYYYLFPPDLEEVELPDSLHPVVAEKRDILVRRTSETGIPILITAGFRLSEEQDELYEQGRSQPGSIVTNAKGGESLHNFGLAIDFALLNKKGEAIWDMEYDGNANGKPDWDEVVAIAKEEGFEWGGDFKGEFKDYPHFQMDFGLSLRELQRGQRPPGNE
ncbi:M15 family metallopeptidase [Bacillus sp. V59.32b]|uniref:M15 family metallopeptidase n=1 Tax=Bacillus sp. V59.32b TaxID=1758642 RepID=UPI000E3D64BF|nr:M15 family metallopeptidase [Bacillus sp. V59.32b]RFU60069.1 M15 family peptidase [Bacillus sp. V59.32b]